MDSVVTRFVWNFVPSVSMPENFLPLAGIDALSDRFKVAAEQSKTKSV